MITFPKGFYWGSATSAPQAEGASSKHGKGPSLWDYWYSIEPEKFHNNIGPEETSGFYDNYKTDIQYLVDTGHNSFRTSISWSRLIPGGVGPVNPEAVTFYNNVIDELIAKGITPMLNLYHFDMPMELQDKGGFENREIVEAFANYAKTCFELFGDRVKTWFTFNEPIVPVEAGYMYQFHYPNVVDLQRAMQVAYNTQMCSSRAIQEYRKLDQGGKISVILNLTPSYPRDEKNPGDVAAAKIADAVFNGMFLDPAVKGEFPAVLMEILAENDISPVTEPGDAEILKDSLVDFLGVNYYQPRRVKERTEPAPAGPLFALHNLFESYDMPGKRMNPHRGWEIYPKGMYDIAINIKENYGNIEWMITENGMGVEGEEQFIVDGMVEDDYRIDFYKEHLEWLHKGIEEGSNCMGYHVWTFIDCWSWCNAYKNRYGFVALDLETKTRTIKRSGHWFKDMTAKNGF